MWSGQKLTDCHKVLLYVTPIRLVMSVKIISIQISCMQFNNLSIYIVNYDFCNGTNVCFL